MTETDVRSIQIWAGDADEYTVSLSHVVLSEREIEAYSIPGVKESQALCLRVGTPEMEVVIRLPLGSLRRLTDFMTGYATEFDDDAHNRDEDGSSV